MTIRQGGGSARTSNREDGGDLVEVHHGILDVLVDLLTATRRRLAGGELKAADIAFNSLTKPADLPPTASPNEAAAWTVVCRVLLNLDATLTKG